MIEEDVDSLNYVQIPSMKTWDPACHTAVIGSSYNAVKCFTLNDDRGTYSQRNINRITLGLHCRTGNRVGNVMVAKYKGLYIHLTWCAIKLWT